MILISKTCLIIGEWNTVSKVQQNYSQPSALDGHASCAEPMSCTAFSHLYMDQQSHGLSTFLIQTDKPRDQKINDN